MGDATRSRLANLLRKAGGGALNLYAVTNHKQRLAIAVIATCSEDALDVIRDIGISDWTLANTATRAVQRRIIAERGLVCAFELEDRNKPIEAKTP